MADGRQSGLGQRLSLKACDSTRNRQLVLVLLLLAVVTGCSGPTLPELAEVEGVVKDKAGNGLPEIYVLVMPEPAKDRVVCQPSWGETDANGRFVLHYQNDNSKPGATVGNVRVVLEDIKAANFGREETEGDDNANPAQAGSMNRRFNAKYLTAASTDLRFEIKAGQKNTLEIVVDPFRGVLVWSTHPGMSSRLLSYPSGSFNNFSIRFRSSGESLSSQLSFNSPMEIMSRR